MIFGLSQEQFENTLREALLPSDEGLRAFFGHIPERAPWYYLRTLDKMGAGTPGPLEASGRSSAGWTSLSSGNGEIPRTGIHGVAARLCENETAPLLGVVDPLAGLVTLVWDVDECIGTRREGNAASVFGRYIEATLHRYLSLVSPYAIRLGQRPGIQMAFVALAAPSEKGGPGRLVEAHGDFRRAFQDTLRHVGLGMADIRIRWIWHDPNQDGRALLEEVLAAHAPAPPWPPHGPATAVSDDEVRERTKELADFREKLTRAATDLASPTGDSLAIWKAAGTLAGLVSSFPPATVTESDDRAPQREETGPPSPMLLLDLQVGVRAFATHPVHLPLAPITLLGSENASGKTTVVEALSQLILGRPRVRGFLPEQSREWNDTRPGAPRSVASVSATAVVPVSESTEVENIPTVLMLPLFADDADLSAGNIGETSLLTLWAFPATAALKKQLLDLTDLLYRLKKQTRVLPEKLGEAKTPKDVALPKRFAKALRAYLAQSSNDEPSPGNGGNDPGPKARVLKKLQKRRTRFQGIPAGDLEQILEDEKLWPYLGRWWAILDNENGWETVGKVDQALKGSRPIRDILSRKLDEYRKALEEEVADYAKEWAQRLFPTNGNKEAQSHLKFERLLDRYLDTRLESYPAETVRSNTAHQVRMGLVDRLARWLLLGRVDLPVLALDEPLLGQDAPSAVLAAGHFLRLRRKVETIRWAERAVSAHRGNGDMPGEAPAGSGTGARQAAARLTWTFDAPDASIRPSDQVADDRQIGPLPPQVLLVTHQAAALDAICDAEGMVLDHDRQRRLQQLIPDCWRPELRKSMADAVARYREDRSRGHVMLEQMPSPALRLYWRFPLPDRKLPPVDLGYLKRATQACEALGLDVLQAHVVQIARAEGFPPDDWEDESGYPGREETRETRQRLLARFGKAFVLWLLWNDLLPAILADADRVFHVSTLSLRELPNGGGECREQGPIRLRRVGVGQQWLPYDLVPRDEPLLPGREDRKPRLTRDAVLGALLVDTEPPLWRVQGGQTCPEAVIRNAGLLPDRTEGHVTELPDGPLRIVDKKTGALLEEVVPAEGEVKVSTDRLSRVLMELRVNRLADRFAEEDRLCFTVWTYAPDTIPSSEVVFSFGSYVQLADPEQRKAAAGTWEKRVFDPLRTLKTLLLKHPNLQNLRVYPQCPPGLALGVGTVFVHHTGMSMEVMQNREPWDVDFQPYHPPEGGVAQPLVDDLPPGWLSPTGHEFHLLISVARDVAPAYLNWASRVTSESMKPCHVLHVASERPGNFLLTRENVSDWATFIHHEFSGAWENAARARREKFRRQGTPPPRDSLTTRIFMAVPLALATAFGRHLNARGTIITMDLEKESRTYYESGRFQV